MPKSSYSTGFATGSIDHNLNPEGQMKKYKTEERETHEAPQILPYEFSALPQHYAEVVDNLISASKALENVLRDGKWENNPDLMKLKNNTDKAVMYFMQNVDVALDSVTVGGNMKENEAKLG